MAVSRTGKLNKRLTFLKNIPTKGPNGTPIKEPVVQFSCWFGYKQKFVNQIREEMLNDILEDIVTLVIRQKQKKEPQLDWIIRINHKDYDIIKINPDVENNDFMIIMCRMVK